MLFAEEEGRERRLEALRAVVVDRFPELAAARFTLLTEGWDHRAVDVDDRLIFRFPRDEEAEAGLATEARLLELVRQAVRMPVPELRLHDGPPVFSGHVKLPGEHLVTAQYRALPEAAREALAAAMAAFYAELHDIDPAAMASAGARPIGGWQAPEAILRRGVTLLPAALQPGARRQVAEWQDAGPDPFGTTYGYFDGHGWNMAFDHRRQRLNGVYDFGDSGFGPLQQEFVYAGFIDRDLVWRIADRYATLTGRALDRRRIELLGSVLRLSELAELAAEPAHVPARVRAYVEWMGGTG
jgi:aminoglycoside phosphotransferase (APT) family kinase protein